jgi:hypothetical protein
MQAQSNYRERNRHSRELHFQVTPSALIFCCCFGKLCLVSVIIANGPDSQYITRKGLLCLTVLEVTVIDGHHCFWAYGKEAHHGESTWWSKVK